MSRSPAERLAMASRRSMGARALARMALGPGASERDVRRLVFLRFYGRELGETRAFRIFDAIEPRREAR